MFIGRIYQITHNDEKMDICYVGSTFRTLAQRFSEHRRGYKNYLKGIGNITIFKYFAEFGIENFSIELIKEYNVVDTAHLRAYEQLYINTIKCVNKSNPVRYLKKLYQKQYNRDNREILKEKKKQYYEVNKAVLNEKQRQYRDANRDHINEKKKQYYETNKEIINEKQKTKITCGCGSAFSKSNRSQHNKSKKHKLWLRSQN